MDRQEQRKKEEREERKRKREGGLYNCYIIAEWCFFILSFFVGYILSFGLVRLRTIWLSALAGSHIECRCLRSCAEDVTITNIMIKPPDWGANDVMPWSDGLRILKKAVSWDLTLNETSWDLKLGKASPVCGPRDARAFVWSVSWDSDSWPRVQLGSWLKDDMGTIIIVKIVCVSLSSYRKTISQKKSIVSYLNYKSRQCFGIPMQMDVLGIRILYIHEYFTWNR